MFFEALKKSCPVPMNFEQINGGAKGYFHTVENRIAIREGMSQVQTIKTAIHEMTHQKLHSIDPNKNPDPSEPKITRNQKELEAESVAFTVCQYYGIDTADYSFAYVASWSHGKETSELKASLDRIRRAADEMITEIDGHLAELQHDHSQEQLTAADVPDLRSSIREPEKKASVLATLQEKKEEARFDTAKEPKKESPVKGTHAKKKEEER